MDANLTQGNESHWTTQRGSRSLAASTTRMPLRRRLQTQTRTARGVSGKCGGLAEGLLPIFSNPKGTVSHECRKGPAPRARSSYLMWPHRCRARARSENRTRVRPACHAASPESAAPQRLRRQDDEGRYRAGADTARAGKGVAHSRLLQAQIHVEMKRRCESVPIQN
jgi:hypothetical protein